MSALQKLSLTLRCAANSASITGPAPSLLNYKRKKGALLLPPPPCFRLEFMDKCRRAALWGFRGLKGAMFCNFRVQRSHDLQSDRATLVSTIGEAKKFDCQSRSEGKILSLK